MKQINIFLSFAFLTLGVSLSTPAGADPLPDAITPVNAFTVGIGEAGVSVTGDPSVAYWNPAGVGVTSLVATDFTMAAPTLELPGSWSFLLVNTKGNSRGGFGLAILRRNFNKGDVEFRSFQINTPLSHSFKTGMIPVGFSVKFISERTGGSDWKYGLALDTGIMLATATGFRVGLVGYNLIGSNLRTFRSKSLLGISWGGSAFPILVAAQVRTERMLDKDYIAENFNIGMQANLTPELPQLRAGWLRSDGKGWMTLGFSFGRPRSSSKIDYTLAIKPDGWKNAAHIVTLSWSQRPSGTRKPRTKNLF